MADISRRGFVQAVSAFAGLGLLPSWLAFKQRRQIDLTPFCDDDDYRWSISRPFAQDGMVYATDARILCRTTLAEAPELADGARLPAASQLPWWRDSDLQWRPWPKLKLFADKAVSTCPKCWGRGCVGRTARCRQCDGDGFLACDENAAGAHWHDFGDDKGNLFRMDCGGCQGSGYTSPDGRCDYCGGTGNTNRPALQMIGNLAVAGHYDSRVRGLGEVEYAVCGNAGCAPEDAWLVKFRGDGFEGLLMPLDMQFRRR